MLVVLRGALGAIITDLEVLLLEVIQVQIVMEAIVMVVMAVGVGCWYCLNSWCVR